MELKVAIMQPYFFPYAGYYRLFGAADIFVVLDCVQFPRRGWVHRNRVSQPNSTHSWLTLPLAKASRDSRICDMQFHQNMSELWAAQLRQFPVIQRALDLYPELRSIVESPRSTPRDYLVETLSWVTDLLGLRKATTLSSRMKLPPGLRGEDRIIEICTRLGATHYVNAPSGRSLYSPDNFERADLQLEFLTPYEGSFHCILERLADESPIALRNEILQQTVLEAAEPEVVY